MLGGIQCAKKVSPNGKGYITLSLGHKGSRDREEEVGEGRTGERRRRGKGNRWNILIHKQN